MLLRMAIHLHYFQVFRFQDIIVVLFHAVPFAVLKIMSLPSYVCNYSLFSHFLMK